MSDVTFSSKVSGSTKNKITAIKKGIEKSLGKKVNNQIAMEKIINTSSLVLDRDDILESVSKGEYGILKDAIKVNEIKEVGKDESPSEAVDEIAKIAELYSKTAKAIKALIVEGPKGLESFDNFGDANTLRIFPEFNKDRISKLFVPGIYIMVDEDTNKVLNIVGAEELTTSLLFMEKALKKGRANKGKPDEYLNKRYGNRSNVYRKFKNLAGFKNIRYEIISLDAPKSIAGRSVILQVIKDNPESYYDVDEFGKIG